MIYLSFDIEEFDNPIPCTQTIGFEEQMEISRQGTIRILDILAAKGVRATFFCTVVFAQNAPEIIARILAENHEIASHGYYHNRFQTAHLKESKQALERITQLEIKGFRMANMANVETDDLIEAGYVYDSSLNPTFLPGKFNHLDKPRRIFWDKTLCEIPASVSSWFRIPLFWVTMHNFPLFYYHYLCKKAMEKDGYLNIYFHPWEFVDLDPVRFELPFVVRRNSGVKLVKRMEDFISHFQKKGVSFGVLSELVALQEE